VIGGCHVNDFVGLIDFEKESPSADPVSPRWRAPVLEPFDVRTVVWLGSELRIDMLPELLRDPA